MDRVPPPVAIVDDDDGIRNALDLLLRTAGFEVRAFASAEQFLTCPPAPPAACLILDVHLPGLSGFDLWERVRAPRGGGPAVVFITAHDTAADRLRAQRLDGAYLAKPFAGRRLLDVVRRLAQKETLHVDAN